LVVASLALRIGWHVGVGVEGDADGCVPEELLNDLRVCVFAEERRGTRA